AASPRRSLDVTVNGEPWVPDLPSGSVTSRQDGRLRVLVDASVPMDSILESAHRAGHVNAFSFEPPSLSDLFLEAVSKERVG
ncbi:MAG TPA: DUF4162 domain-containing protein, partial [Actinomycetota bacterium]|nr:DUF4162 domain-containing protein [Actinomycetota bacterium]